MEVRNEQLRKVPSWVRAVAASVCLASAGVTLGCGNEPDQAPPKTEVGKFKSYTEFNHAYRIVKHPKNTDLRQKSADFNRLNGCLRPGKNQVPVSVNLYFDDGGTTREAKAEYFGRDWFQVAEPDPRIHYKAFFVYLNGEPARLSAADPAEFPDESINNLVLLLPLDKLKDVSYPPTC